jgi:hypothetical protein
MVGSIFRIHSALKCLMNQILTCFCRSQLFELCRIFKGYVSYRYVMTLAYIISSIYMQSLSQRADSPDFLTVDLLAGTLAVTCREKGC